MLGKKSRSKVWSQHISKAIDFSFTSQGAAGDAKTRRTMQQVTTQFSVVTFKDCQGQPSVKMVRKSGW